MLPPAGNGTLQAIIDLCRACRRPAEAHLARLESSAGEDGVAFAATLRCVALLTVIADTLEADGYCPAPVLDATIELARELPDDSVGCAAACRAAADVLSEWLDGTFEH